MLCGPSGCGKSTLLRRLKPAVAPHGTVSGEIFFCGEHLDGLSAREQAEKIGFVQQSPENQIVTDKVWHELAFGLESLGLSTPVIRRRTAEIASFFGINEWFYKETAALSGGQKQLLNLASVMAMQPELLILDEPTSRLDPIAASDFLAVLGKINRELGTTIILTEHRLEEAFAFANKAAVMENGRIICCGAPRDTGLALRERGSGMFLAMPAAMRIWAGVETQLSCPLTAAEGKNFLSEYFAENPVCGVPRRNPAQRCGKPVLTAENVFFRYEKELPDVLKGFSAELFSGEIFAVLGGNGAGKTTALRVLSRQLTPYRGEVKKERTAGVLPQEPQTLFVKKTVREDLFDAIPDKRIPRSEKEEKIAQAVSLCRLTELLDRHPYDLSGGEQQRAALAKLLITSPGILFLDEPTKGFDAQFKREFGEIIRRLAAGGTAVFMISHDIEFCAEYADRCAMFFDGSFTAQGEPTEFFSGNSFYTTCANRMARDIDKNIVTVADAVRLCGGIPDEPAELSAPAVTLPKPPETSAAFKPKRLPLWRKITAALCGITAAGIFFCAAGITDLTKLVNKDGMTELAGGQLVLYAVFVAALFGVVASVGRRSAKPPQAEQKKEKRKLPRRTAAAAVMILLFIPLTLFIDVEYLGDGSYNVISTAVLLECMLPFFLIFEGRRPKARELVTIAVLCAIGVAGRAAFFMLPQFKPVMAVTIIAGVAFGGETGFLVGAVTMLTSNILFSQGPWTAWQMFAMGIIGFVAGVLFRKGLLRRSRGSLAVFGAIMAVVVYGGIMNPASALMWGGSNLNAQIILTYYITGFPMDCVHAAATAFFLLIAAEPMLEKLDRIKVKYGLNE